MAQIDLFDMSKQAIPVWERLSDPKWGKLRQEWRHNPSGWYVQHAGHPTANYPWYAERPTGRRDAEGRELYQMVVSHNGMAFKHLKTIKAAVEGVHAGALEILERGDEYPRFPRVEGAGK